MHPNDPPLDLAIVGAGIGGVVHLHYARRAGLKALVLEKEGAVGGLWRQLPAWQDIQISPQDWTLGDLPLAGSLQPDILANIESWVTRFGLADGIRFHSPVRAARFDGELWQLQTPQGTVRARHLVAATGGHNMPVIPAVTRDDVRLQELHSSALHDATQLRGRDVLVVGGGASAFDLLDLCLAHGARRIAWVHRGFKWFLPTSKPKSIAGSVRGFARLQASGMTRAQQSAAIHEDMRGRYAKFGIESLLPGQAFDVQEDQLIPGRPRMLAAFARLERYTGSVAAIAGRTVTLTGGERFDADFVLWGTGYTVDLGWIDVPAVRPIRTVNDIVKRTGCIVRSLDVPNLYLPGVGLDGIGSSPWAFSLIARTIMSHIRGTAQLDLAPVGHKINHFDIVNHLAPRDRGSYQPGVWEEQYRRQALETPDDQPYPIP
jgi:cation diffusion facilitator CzcD-associated flavoprotein CzcO